MCVDACIDYWRKKVHLKYRWQFTPHKKLSCGSITTALLLKLLGSLGKDTEKVHFLLFFNKNLLLKCHLRSLSKLCSTMLQLGLTATTASPMAGYGRGHSFFLKMAMVAEF